MADPRAEFVAYLDTLKLPGPLRERALEHYERCRVLTGEDITDPFLSETVENAPTYRYNALWMFARSLGFEVWNFAFENSIDVGSPSKNLTRLEVEPHDYDLGEEPGEDGRLTVTLYVGYGHDPGGATATLRASGPNCLQLRRVLVKHLVPALPTNRAPG